jgi:predicted acyltransferase
MTVTMSVSVAHPEATPSVGKPSWAQAERMVSLDVFRGLTIAGMILVNSSGDGRHTFAPLLHAEWNGWTPTDLVFPFFVFMVGITTAFANASRANRGASRSELMRHTVVRALVIFAIGVGYAAIGTHHWADLRWPGVLQRIAIAYLFTSLMSLTSGRRSWIVTCAGLLVGYWAIMRFVPVPGVGAGHLDPQNNLAAFIDRALVPGRLYRRTWDPEGILSTLPAIGTCLLGLLTGDWLRRERDPRRRIRGLLGIGAVLTLAGWALDPIFPINKNIWTSSYVLFTAGLAMLLLGGCYYVVDVRGWRKWSTPLLVFGTNALAAYVFSEVVEKIMGLVHVTDGGTSVSLKKFAFQHWCAPLSGNPYLASLYWALAYVLFCWMAVWLLYRKKIFIKI